jgi:hypothetical protein
LGQAARQKDHLLYEIDPGGSCRFLPGQIFILKRNLWAKTTAEHGIGITEEAQTLLSKT